MEESISYVSDLGVAELPATVGSAMQPEPCCGRVLGDNGCSIDTKNYTSCPTHDDDDDEIVLIVWSMVECVSRMMDGDGDNEGRTGE